MSKLDRYLIDHCLIFLREISHDYGPIPFKVFHYWFDIDDFNNLVEGIWKGYQSKELNPIRFFIGQLKVIKRKIRKWNNSRRSTDISLFSKLKLDLESIDEITNRGDGNDEIMCKRSGIINNLNDLSNIQTMEDEFFNHFSTRFQNPDPKEAYIEMDFPNVLSLEDRQFIEREASIDEIKKVVWDSGTDNAPGPDGFTFGFYRRYWDLIHGEVTNAV
nr:RNA-directed DNA polymerase, eukaryota, reverse transcriptase zinc-binding domain protein [Tanacetum cinerariifolium]